MGIFLPAVADAQSAPSIQSFKGTADTVVGNGSVTYQLTPWSAAQSNMTFTLSSSNSEISVPSSVTIVAGSSNISITASVTLNSGPVTFGQVRVGTD